MDEVPAAVIAALTPHLDLAYAYQARRSEEPLERTPEMDALQVALLWDYAQALGWTQDDAERAPRLLVRDVVTAWEQTPEEAERFFTGDFVD